MDCYGYESGDLEEMLIFRTKKINLMMEFR